MNPFVREIDFHSVDIGHLMVTEAFFHLLQYCIGVNVGCQLYFCLAMK